MAKGNNARKKEVKKPKKRGIKGNPPTRNLPGRTYPGTVGLPMPDLPGTDRT